VAAVIAGQAMPSFKVLDGREASLEIIEQNRPKMIGTAMLAEITPQLVLVKAPFADKEAPLVGIRAGAVKCAGR